MVGNENRVHLAIDHLAGRQPPEHATLQQVLLCPDPRVRHRGRGAFRLLVLQESFQNADRRVERGAHGAPLRLAVPAAVLELLAEEPVEQPIAGLAEVAAKRQNPTVDAGLDLALEERRVTEFRPPGDLVADEAHRPPRSLARRVQPQVPQEQQGVQVGPPLRCGDAITPLAVRPLKVEEPGAPTFRGNPRPLGGDDLVGLVGEVAHDLPTDRRVRIEQPGPESIFSLLWRLPFAISY